MNYSFKRFLNVAYMTFFKTEDNTPAKLTPKRVFVLSIFYALYITVEIITWISFLMDDIFFRKYRQQPVRKPVFIVGNPRSGTTFLHRLLAKDEQNFTSIHLWEILFAPSVTQRKIAWSLAKLDRWLAGILHRAVMSADKLVRASNVMHRMSLLIPEEDEYFLIHQGATIIAGLFFGFPGAAYPFVFFDTQLSHREKRHVMRFYRHCLQRHLFAHKENKQILSKNPYFAPKVDALYEFFPDAKIVYLARNPLNVVPSYASLSAHWWHMLGEPEKQYPHPEYILTATQHWYRYPVERLEQAPESSRILVNFNDLVSDPEHVVRDIYDHFDMEISPAFAATLREETERARQHKSEHKYSLEGVGFTREQIVTNYRDVFDRWGFDTNGA